MTSKQPGKRRKIEPAKKQPRNKKPGASPGLRAVVSEMSTKGGRRKKEATSTGRGRAHRNHGQVNLDVFSLLSNMNLSMLFMDAELRVRRVINEIPLRFTLPDLKARVGEVMKIRKPMLVGIHGSDGREYELQIRPYPAEGKHVAGALVAIADTTELTKRTADLSATRKSLRKEKVKRAGAEEFSRAGEVRFRDVADSLPELIAFVDARQRYRYCNTSYEKRLGFFKDELIGRSLREVLGDALYATVKPLVKKALAGQPASFEGYVSHERFGRRYIHIDYVPHRNAQGAVDGFYSVNRNLTELKAAEEKFRAFIQNAPVAIIIHSPNGKIVLANAQTESLFGYSRDELIGQPVKMLIPERMRRKYLKESAAYMKNPSFRPMGIGLELTAVRRDGHEFPVEMSLRPMETVSVTFVSATVIDLTDRKRLEEQTLLTSVLQERAQLARNLHDTLAQGLSGISLLLEAAEENFPKPPKQTRILLQRAAHLAHENTMEVRRSLEELSGPLGGRLGDLAGSLRKLAARPLQNGETPVKFFLRGIPRPLSALVEENLLFIARQATDNSLQHARASKIHLTLSFTAKDLRLQAQDDGCGFDVKNADHGFGMTSMRDRAKYIGGRFKLNSHPGEGTLVEVNVPISDGRSHPTYR